MPRLPTLPPNTLRFFARLDRFCCECPRCGTLIRAHLAGSRGSNVGEAVVRQAEYQARWRLLTKLKIRFRPGQPPEEILPTPGPPIPRDPNQLVPSFNPYTQRLTCPNCQRTWACGLLLYPVMRGTTRAPWDTRPTYRQLTALRQMAGGFLVNQKLRSTDAVNMFVEGSCLCREGDPPLARCPVHGSAEHLTQPSHWPLPNFGGMDQTPKTPREEDRPDLEVLAELEEEREAKREAEAAERAEMAGAPEENGDAPDEDD